jgi:hypothetical protein
VAVIQARGSLDLDPDALACAGNGDGPARVRGRPPERRPALILKSRRASGLALADRLPERLIPIAALTLATPVGLLLYSLLFTDLWLPRGLSASMPFAALLIGALLVAMPVRLTALSAAVVAVVLGAGTARSFEPAYARGPFRTIAAYLDRVAGPRDPIRLISVDGSLAVREEIQRPHLLVDSLSAMWSHTAVGGRAYLVVDQTIAQIKRIGTPHEPGFVFLSAAQTPRSPAWRRSPRRLQSAARRVREA